MPSEQTSHQRGLRRWARRPVVLVAVLVAVNAISLSLVGPLIGGKASTGKNENERWYLNDNGRYSEVSHSTFVEIRLWERSVSASIISLVVIGGITEWWEWKRARAKK